MFRCDSRTFDNGRDLRVGDTCPCRSRFSPTDLGEWQKVLKLIFRRIINPDNFPADSTRAAAS